MKERTLTSEEIFSGKIFSMELMKVELEDGSVSEREIIRHRGAVGVLVRRTDGSFVLVRQFRKAIEDYCLEIVAGLMEPGESERNCALRELREETGHEPLQMFELGDVIMAPGYSNERIRLYFATVGDHEGDQDLDDGEHVEVVNLSADELERLVKDGSIADGKTLAALLLYRTAFKDQDPAAASIEGEGTG